MAKDQNQQQQQPEGDAEKTQDEKDLEAVRLRELIRGFVEGKNKSVKTITKKLSQLNDDQQKQKDYFDGVKRYDDNLGLLEDEDEAKRT